ncbi:MAG: DUF2520 domain-containing protein [Myxococcota bacterium]
MHTKTAIEKVTILGRGKVGHGLLRALKDGPFEVRLVSGRTARLKQVQEKEVVVLAVPDHCIAEVSDRLSAVIVKGAVILHCAGARDASELRSCAETGGEVGSMHPLASFASSRRPPDLRKAAFVISGSRKARSTAKTLATTAGANPVIWSVRGAAYHGSATLVANGAAALAGASIQICEKLGMKRRDAERAIGALLCTVGQNIAELGMPRALTGPIARGDAPTALAHRKALQLEDPPGLDVYDRIAPVILASAMQAGLSPEQAASIRKALRARLQRS